MQATGFNSRIKMPQVLEQSGDLSKFTGILLLKVEAVATVADENLKTYKSLLISKVNDQEIKKNDRVNVFKEMDKKYLFAEAILEAGVFKKIKIHDHWTQKLVKYGAEEIVLMKGEYQMTILKEMVDIESYNQQEYLSVKQANFRNWGQG